MLNQKSVTAITPKPPTFPTGYLKIETISSIKKRKFPPKNVVTISKHGTYKGSNSPVAKVTYA